MKKKYIKNKYTLLTIITFLFCFNYSTIFALPGDIVDPLIHKGAGEQEIGYLKLGDTTASGASGTSSFRSSTSKHLAAPAAAPSRAHAV